VEYTEPSRRPLGRPRTFDAGLVAVTAASLFDQRGYAAVTMTEIAQAAGVSRRAMFNHFPSKPHLLWSGFEPYLENLRTRLAAAPADEPLGTAVARCLAQAFDGPASVDRDLARSRMRIVANHPETFEVGQPVMTAMREVLSEHLRTRHQPRLAEFEAECLASAVTAVAFDATIRWATTSQSLPRLLQHAVGALSKART
jgi:AcrR family transcriptional regulator